MTDWKRVVCMGLLAGAISLMPASFTANAKGGPEQHPVIHKAIEQLETVKSELQNQAAHDFEGHRANAIKHIDEAINQLNLALQVDKK